MDYLVWTTGQSCDEGAETSAGSVKQAAMEYVRKWASTPFPSGYRVEVLVRRRVSLTVMHFATVEVTGDSKDDLQAVIHDTWAEKSLLRNNFRWHREGPGSFTYEYRGTLLSVELSPAGWSWKVEGHADNPADIRIGSRMNSMLTQDEAMEQAEAVLLALASTDLLDWRKE